jgi:hypothetical protein
MRTPHVAILLLLGFLAQGCISPSHDPTQRSSGEFAGLGDASELQRRFSAEQVGSILRGEGYGAVAVTEHGDVRFKADGRSYLVLLYEDGDLQLYFSLTGVSVSHAVVNEWNRTKRLSRAYLDSDRDAVLEADLLSDSGVSAQMVTRWVQVFVQGTGLFENFLVENGALDSVPAAANPAAI